MIVFYVSGHGYGHATRVCALIRALKQRRPGLRVAVRTEAPAWLFEEAGPGVSVSAARIDVGMLQLNGLDIDLPRTLRAHEEFLRGWDAAVAREARFIVKSGARLVVGDIPALAFAAAARAGVPSAGVANFSWDWILGRYAVSDRRWRPIIARYRAAYAQGGKLLRLPMHGDFPAFPRISDAPLVVSRSRLTREKARALWGLARKDRRRRVLLTFGGFGAGKLSLAAREDLSDYVFAGFGPKPAGLRADWVEFPPRAPVPHVDIVAGGDAIVGKPGYGTFSEAAAHGIRMLYLPRRGFREVPRLIAWMKRHGTGRLVARADFEAGRWRSALDALFASMPRSAQVSDGAAAVASRLLGMLA
jgi:L-arabinokinase